MLDQHLHFNYKDIFLAPRLALSPKKIWIFILGNLSKNFLLKDKFYFALGASIASIIFFYSLGYLSVFFARFITKVRVWRAINLFIIVFMLLIIAYIVLSTYYLVTNTLN